MKRRLVLVGPGRTGLSLATLLHRAGYPITAIIGRDLERTRAAARFAGCPEAATTDLRRAGTGEIVFITLPDDAIAAMATRLHLEAELAADTVLIHCSGLHPAAILRGEKDANLGALSLHPLQTFPDAACGIEALSGAPFTVEGDEHLLPLGEELVRAVGGQPQRIGAQQKPLYHAAACVASNYLAPLLATAQEMLAACGFDEQTALQLLLPLFRQTSRNLENLGPAAALTGPIARGDVQTVATHLQALAALPADLADLYCTLGKKTVELATTKGTLDRDKATAIREILVRTLNR